MWRWAAVLLLLLPTTSEAGRPQRVASLNLCTDELVLALADPDQIVSLSPMVSDTGASPIADAARGFRNNRGSAEEILREQPDLILAQEGYAEVPLDLLKTLGLRVERLPYVDRLGQISPTVRRAAALLGQEDRGDRLIQQMQQVLDSAPPKATRTALIYESNGWSVGQNTLRGDILSVAGWVNQAANLGLSGYGPLPLEQVAADPPDLLIIERYRPDQASLAEQWLNHPVLRRLAIRTLDLPSSMMICGTPLITDAVERLRRASATP